MAVGTSTVPVRVVARPRRRRRGRRLLRGVLALLVLLAVLLGAGWVLTPSVDDAPQRVAAFLAQHDSPALAGAVPSRLADALIATEDSRFRSNPGVDPVSLLRAPWTLLTGQDAGGATLEQQLAKNLYENGDNSGLQKVTELFLALKLDSSFSKDEILRLYLDDGYYGHGFYGLTAATKGYFGVAPAKLTEAQASLLAGLFQAPDRPTTRSCTRTPPAPGRRTCSTGWWPSARSPAARPTPSPRSRGGCAATAEPALADRPQVGRRLAGVRGCLVRGGQVDQVGVVPPGAEERDADRQRVPRAGEAGGDGDVRVAGHRRGAGGAEAVGVGLAVLLEVRRPPGGDVGQRDDRVEVLALRGTRR